MVDFLLNCLKPQSYNHNDERSAYCEIFIPMFKAFGNATKKLNYVWCEKKAKDSDYLWLMSNNFKREKGNIKLLDGVGRLVDKELNYLMIESSGFNNPNTISHTLNDSLKNMKTGSDNLKYSLSNYRKASFKTVKKISVYTCHIIQNKMTLVRYKVLSPSQWQVVECRSASVPTSFSGIVQYTGVFELFAFLLLDIAEQEAIFHQLELETSGLVKVPSDETVAHHLM
ncbi:hypothetical protein K501DRAFT_297732 [Backusella circina FSU 941]|nr:hypothetical protein K501DRAFT_297732 [Backusella circina FSU 941]